MHPRLATPTAALILLAGAMGLAACDEKSRGWEPSGVHYSQCQSLPELRRNKVDLLFVLDDSSAMVEFQANLRANNTAIIQDLMSLSGGLADLHIGVVTSVLGTAPHNVPGCPAQGHAGLMHRGACAEPTGATYIKDVEPSGCVVTRDATGLCPDHTCEAANCGHEPGTWLVMDEASGCPRCRNFDGSIVDAFTCIADVGASACDFSQPLQAMRQALQNELNVGFRREDAFLGIVFITAQDDCSAANANLFAPQDAELGPMGTFRCFEHGVTCNPNGRAPGPRQDCLPRDDTDGLLTRPGSYIEYLQSIVEPQMLMVAAVTGPYDPDDTLTVTLDAQGHPLLAPSCTVDATMAAAPAVRLQTVLDAFNEEEDLSAWALTSVCGEDYTSAFSGISSPRDTYLEPGCFALPLRGCTDPGAAAGAPRDDETCNDHCLPNCVVNDIQQRGTPSETSDALPHCLEVCADGPCPGNVDASEAYAQGRPVIRDYQLPVPACWFVSHEHCADTGQVMIARQTNPASRSFVDVCCELTPDATADCVGP